MSDCLFCRIAAGDVAADVVYQDDQVIAFKDVQPQAPFHLLVIPKRHVTSAFDLGPDDATLLSRIFEVAKKIAAADEAVAGGVRILTNVGSQAGQVVMHLHFHVLGGRRLGWPPG
ncbi:MAG: histidine triad nucleotide-binding protein [Candidatus Geothermincolia bacterium]